MDQLRTATAQLRRLTPADFERMRLLDADPLVMQFTPARVPQTEEQTRARLSGQIARGPGLSPFGIWLADRISDSSFVGWFMLLPSEDGSLELGFMIQRNAWGQGLATEVAGALVDYAFTRPDITLVTAKTDDTNEASQRVLAKLGFTLVGAEGHTKNFERRAGAR